jgi:hypothetical protein
LTFPSKFLQDFVSCRALLEDDEPSSEWEKLSDKTNSVNSKVWRKLVPGSTASIYRAYATFSGAPPPLASTRACGFL